MSSGNGKNFKTEYIRTILRRTNVSLIYSRNDRDNYTPPAEKPIKSVIKLRRPISLDDKPERVRSEKTVTFREPMTVSGHPSMTQRQSQNDPVSASSERAASETRVRGKSGNDPNGRDASPVQQRPRTYTGGDDPNERDSSHVQQRPRTYERAEAGVPKFGTIRKSYEPDKKFKPLAVFKAFERMPDPEPGNVPESDAVRVNGLTPASELDMDEKVPQQCEELFPIATFPFVGNDELDKHKKLNAEAELGRSKTSGPYDSYLKRLRLERKALEPNKPKDLSKVKRKPVLKKLPTKARWLREAEEPELEKPTPPPPKPKERVSRILLDFKYSHAMEQLYQTQQRQAVNFSPMSDSFVNYGCRDDTEVKNGCFVKTLGANVLNLQARSMPSCNPFELRMRRQLARERAMLSKKPSILSQSSVKSHMSHDSLLRLRKISVARKESTVSNAFVEENASISGSDTEHARLHVARKSVDSQPGFPDIRIDRVENLVTRSLNSSPDGPEYLRKQSNSHARIISLNLPTVIMEDL